ncbi:MAG: hypothetical protein ACRDCE_00310 [Cetobacterium sp.]|uniref:hypothetical protein n=1 Tax=Cetobacterium sp. TaxID=2071632 RepID=UPI003EE57BCE
MLDVGQATQETNAIEEEIDKEILGKIQNMIKEAEESAKAVWEIDGTTVYVRDIQISESNEFTVDWFTFRDTLDKNELGAKVEQLAKMLFEEETKCKSVPLFSRICSTIKNTFGLSGRT